MSPRLRRQSLGGRSRTIRERKAARSRVPQGRRGNLTPFFVRTASYGISLYDAEGNVFPGQRRCRLTHLESDKGMDFELPIVQVEIYLADTDERNPVGVTWWN